MRSATTAALGVLRLAGLAQVVLGALFWTGNGDALLPLHITIGFALVLALWALAALAAGAGVAPGAVALAAAWGLLVPILGLTQQRLLPGDGHWLVQVAHLLLGLGAISQGEGLATRIDRRRHAGPAAPISTAG